MGTQLELESYWGRADYLFAPGSFATGAASVLDLGGTLVYFNASRSPQAADGWALAQDWYCVGDALRSAISDWHDSQVR